MDKTFNWITPFVSLLAGGLAGMASWASAYPLDLWKSNVQRALTFPSTPGHLSFRRFITNRYRELGVGGEAPPRCQRRRVELTLPRLQASSQAWVRRCCALCQ